jgi:DNA-binding MarR family transcriptional regulator
MNDKRFLFGSLFAISNKLQVVGDLFLGEMTAKQWLVLESVADFTPAHPSLTQLSSKLGSSRQNVKQLALRLEALGYARLVPDAKDHREVCVALTDKARDFLSSRDQDSLDFLSSLFDGLSTDEISATLQTLEALNANVQRLHDNYT